ncbi:molybdopterin molybdotransferase MoeA [Amnibacterium kyonggiense]|uniref:Molybdopterin molybdenumtransferase n=1 Tax=Amnibacterium kyonggiense TaxID=595671 RepID=A0A4R7FS92_9MICO|nr:molybdopterin molybdotransferase MoeA [Amnibacterium kyonggiense]TDS80608.1 molybdopterin molybdotransferase [Amnibacterium kyonggiense]
MTADLSWAAARELAASWPAGPVVDVPIREAVGAVLADDVLAPRPIPHYDSSAMDGWAVAGPPPWRITEEDVLVPGQAHPVVTGGAIPLGAVAVVPLERGVVVDGLLDAHAPEPGAHVRRAGEEAPAGAVLAAAGGRLSPAVVAVLAIAGVDAVSARRRPRVAFVLTGDEVDTAGLPAAGRVRDAFDPLLPAAATGLGADALPPVRVGDDPAAIRAATSADADVVVTVGGTGRSRVDRLRDALGDAEVLADGVAMRPGHPALLARLPDGRPLLGLPGNPLAAVAVLLSFLPPLLDALTGSTALEAVEAPVAVDLPGWPGGTSLVPCRWGEEGLEPAGAARPNMLRGLAASDVLAVVPPEGVAAGETAEVLPLPW